MAEQDPSGAPDADAFASPDSPPYELLDAVRSAAPSKAVTADLLANTSDTALFHLMPLLMSTLQFIGEVTSDRDDFYTVASTLRKRVLANRVLKLRFLLHASHPSFNAYWRYTEEFVDDGDRDIYLEQEEDDEEDEEERAMLMEWDDDDPDAFEETFYDPDEEVDEEVEQLSGKKNVKQVIFKIPVDSVDIESKTFWTEKVYDTADVDDGFMYDVSSSVANPFFRGFGMDESGIGSSVVVRHVFSSIARPKIVEVCTDSDGEQAVQPGMMVKSGDNLMQDLGVMAFFQFCNALWASDEGLQEGGVIPVAMWYDVMPVSIENGLLQAVSKLDSLKDFDWPAWQARVDGDDAAVNDMVRSVAGAYIGTYIIGGRDRHFDNILVRDGHQLLHIDFTYIFGNHPALDAPPIALASEMQAAFEALGVWDRFVDLCVAAFVCVRNSASDVLRVVLRAFARSGVTTADINAFMRSKTSLYLAADDEVAAKYVRKQVETGASNLQTWVKRIAHDVIDPAWYGLLQKGFPPAVAIMDLLDKSENAEAVKLAQQLKEEGDSVMAGDAIEVDDDEEE